MNTPLYDALKDAGAPDASARAAAIAVPNGEELATKQDIAEVRAEAKHDSAEIRGEIKVSRAETLAEFKAVHAEFKAVRAEAKQDNAETRAFFANEMFKQTLRYAAVLFTGLGVFLGLAVLVARLFLVG